MITRAEYRLYFRAIFPKMKDPTMPDAALIARIMPIVKADACNCFARTMIRSGNADSTIVRIQDRITDNRYNFFCQNQAAASFNLLSI